MQTVKFEICMPEVYEIEWKYIEINTQKIYQNWAPDVSSTQYQLSTLGSQGHNLGISFMGREEIYFFPTMERVKMYGA